MSLSWSERHLTVWAWPWKAARCKCVQLSVSVVVLYPKSVVSWAPALRRSVAISALLVLHLAIFNGVKPFSSRDSTLAPAFKSRSTMALWPFSTARCSGVYPHRSWTSIAAPRAKSSLTIPVWPQSTAWCNKANVNPSISLMAISAPWSNSQLAISISFRWTAYHKAGFPWLSCSLMYQGPCRARYFSKGSCCRRFAISLVASCSLFLRGLINWCPLATARSHGVLPSSFLVLIDAPRIKKSSVITGWFCCTAQCMGVQPRWSWTSLFTLWTSYERSNSTIEACSFCIARCNGVQPAWSLIFIAKPRKSKNLTIAAWPCCAAQCNGVEPDRSPISAAAPRSKSRSTTYPWPSWAAQCSGVKPILSCAFISDWCRKSNLIASG